MSITCSGCDNKSFIKFDCESCHSTGFEYIDSKTIRVCKNCNGDGKILVKCLSEECERYRKYFNVFCTEHNKKI